MRVTPDNIREYLGWLAPRLAVERPAGGRTMQA
jgi:hypothetical protein